MRAFSGFSPGRARKVSLPEAVFSELLPLIDDLHELKVTLHILWRLADQRGQTVRYLRQADLANDTLLLAGLGPAPLAALEAALARAVERGSLLVAEEPPGSGERLIFANTPRGRAAVEALANGRWPRPLEAASRSNVFALYEQNIGPLSPLLVDELREAETTYPVEWIEEAFRIAVGLNKRNWRYIRAILERWRTEGKDDEEAGGTSAGDGRRYIRGEYGPYIQH